MHRSPGIRPGGSCMFEAFWFFFSSPFVSRWITPGSLCWIFTAGRADAECPRSPLAPLARRPPHPPPSSPHPPPSPPHPPPNPSFQTGHTSLANLDSSEGHSSKCWSKNTKLSTTTKSDLNNNNPRKPFKKRVNCDNSFAIK